MRRRLSHELAAAAVVALAAVTAGSAAPTLPATTSAAVPGAWQKLPRAPVAVIDQSPTSVWTGKEMIVVGRRTTNLATSDIERVYVGAAYNPASRTWRRIPSPPPSVSGIYGFTTVWTGKELLLWGQGTRAAFDPATNRWRLLPPEPALDGAALVVWTGREMIGWGGGCCGEAWADGVAYNPSTNTWRKLAISPLHGAQHPVGAWTGRELVVLVGGVNPSDGKPWPGRFARAAAYDPATDTWRRIALPPSPRDGATAVWDGREVLLIGGYARDTSFPWLLARTGFAYNPATNTWRTLPPLDSGRMRFASVWTGKRLLIWGGTTVAGGGVPAVMPLSPPRGNAYEPAANRWTALPRAPVGGRLDPTSVWTGRSFIVWGGGTGLPPYRSSTDGAAFTSA